MFKKRLHRLLEHVATTLSYPRHKLQAASMRWLSMMMNQCYHSPIIVT